MSDPNPEPYILALAAALLARTKVCVPSRADIHQITERLDEATKGVTAIGNCLASVPGPTIDQLRSLPTAALQECLHKATRKLHALGYNAALTNWVNDTCLLASRVEASFDAGLSGLQLLYDTRPATKRYHARLADLRRCFLTLADELADLREQFEVLLPFQTRPIDNNRIRLAQTQLADAA